MPHDVFISHSSKDKLTADAVCAMLESNGVRCWIAPRDVTPGMEWGECIIEAIQECRIMVLVFTTEANASPQIRREVERAVNHGMAILPLRVEDVVPGRALEYFIGNVHWLDALTQPLETHLISLAGTVKMLLGRMEQREAPGLAPPIYPAASALPKSGVAESAPPPKAMPSPPEGPSKWPSGSAAAKASWRKGDTPTDAVAPTSRIDSDVTAMHRSPAEEATSLTPPSQKAAPPQSSFEAPSIARTAIHKETSALGDTSTASSAARTPAAPVVSIPSRRGSRTSLILIAIAVVGAVVVLGVIYRSQSKGPDSAVAQGPAQNSQPSIQSPPSNPAGGISRNQPPNNQTARSQSNTDRPTPQTPSSSQVGKGIGPSAASTNKGAELGQLPQKAPTSVPSPPARDAGELYKQGTVLEANGKLSEAASSYQASCDGGEAAGCRRLGNMYATSEGVAKDESRAAQLFQKSCDGGIALGCSNLGIMYANGRGVAKDESRAVQLYQRACNGGDPHGCSNLGVMYASGRGVATDESRALQLYQKGCDGGDAIGCYGLGFMYGNGRGVARDASRALQLYQKACDLGDAQGCANVRK